MFFISQAVTSIIMISPVCGLRVVYSALLMEVLSNSHGMSRVVWDA